MEAVRRENRKRLAGEIAPEDTERRRAEPAEAGPEPKIEAEPIEIKSEPR